MRSLNWALIQYDKCPYEKASPEHRHMHTGSTRCENEEGDQGDVSTSQGIPRSNGL